MFSAFHTIGQILDIGSRVAPPLMWVFCSLAVLFVFQNEDNGLRKRVTVRQEVCAVIGGPVTIVVAPVLAAVSARRPAYTRRPVRTRHHAPAHRRHSASQTR